MVGRREQATIVTLFTTLSASAAFTIGCGNLFLAVRVPNSLTGPSKQSTRGPFGSISFSSQPRADLRLCTARESEAEDMSEKKVSTKEAARLLEDEEYIGLSLEVAKLVRQSLGDALRDAAKATGTTLETAADISVEADTKIKRAIADLRGKEQYELGDLSTALDEICKDEISRITGKDEYELGDLSLELNRRVLAAAARFCGKEEGEYEPGDITLAIDRRVKDSINSFTGQDEYSFGDVTQEIERRRAQWVKKYTGNEGEYQFGDITKRTLANYLGSDDYEFGDLTKRAVSSFTGKDEYKFGDITRTIAGKLFGKQGGEK